MASKSKINGEKLRNATSALKAIASTNGVEILQHLEENGRCNVNQIYSTLQIEQSMCSQKLKAFRQFNLVSTEREGKKIFYSLNWSNLNPILDFANGVSE